MPSRNGSSAATWPTCSEITSKVPVRARRRPSMVLMPSPWNSLRSTAKPSSLMASITSISMGYSALEDSDWLSQRIGVSATAGAVAQASVSAAEATVLRYMGVVSLVYGRVGRSGWRRRETRGRAPEEAAPAGDARRVPAEAVQRFPHHGSGGIEERDAEFALDGLGQTGPAHVGAHDHEALGPALGGGPAHIEDLGLRDVGKREIVGDAGMRFAGDLVAGLRVGLNDLGLHVAGIGRDEAEAPAGHRVDQVVQREHGGAGGDARLGGDRVTQLPVAVESQPARRGAAPGDDTDPGIGQLARGVE